MQHTIPALLNQNRHFNKLPKYEKYGSRGLYSIWFLPVAFLLITFSGESHNPEHNLQKRKDLNSKGVLKEYLPDKYGGDKKCNKGKQ